MKKFFVPTVLFVLIIFSAVTEKVEAKDIWIANKGENIHYYIMAETFKKTIGDNFSVVIKTVYHQGNRSTNRTWDAHTYEFEMNSDGQWYYSNEQPPIWYPADNDAIAKKVCNFFVKYFE